MTFVMPGSSSSSRKTMPLAVCGRWRAIIMPATVTVRPWRSVRRSSDVRIVSGGDGRTSAIRCGPVVRCIVS